MQKIKAGIHLSASRYFIIAAVLAILVYVSAIPVTLMEPDAATYADIPMEMIHRHDFHDIFLKGKDWLDKPHLQFWITAVSYKILGINNAGYKLPAILFALLAIGFTYLYGRKFYSALHGAIAALILASAFHFNLSLNDVRAEPFLAGLTIFSMYYFAIYLKEKKFIQLLLGSASLGFLMMTKGLFTIIPVASAIGLTLIITKKWKEILNVQWLAVIILTVIFISPSLICYYFQFDLHPGKKVFGQFGVSGVRFFLWDSQWGRFTNSGPIRGHGDPFFFVHTSLWAFAPWAFLFIHSVILRIRDMFKRNKSPELYTVLGFLFMFLVFSLSRFQLPYYIVPLFPFMAIISAGFLVRGLRNRKWLRIHSIIMLCSILILTAAVLALHLFFFRFPDHLAGLVLFSVAAGILIFLFLNEKIILKKLIFPAALMSLLLQVYLNRVFYPQLLHYQSNSEVAFYIKEHHLPLDKLVFLNREHWVTEFYLHRVIPDITENDVSGTLPDSLMVFTNLQGLRMLERYGHNFRLITTFPDFHVTLLNKNFLYWKTRDKALGKTYLVRLDPGQAFKNSTNREETTAGSNPVMQGLVRQVVFR